MKRLSILALPFFMLALCVGCGGDSTAPSVPTSQDELAKWNAENPAPPETPVD